MLILGAFNFIFIGILRILVEVGLALAVYAYSKNLSGFGVSSTGCNCIFDNLE
jgi:hypothetical protein